LKCNIGCHGNLKNKKISLKFVDENFKDCFSKTALNKMALQNRARQINIVSMGMQKPPRIAIQTPQS
jgi:uncharacterized pyridoxal phosphate-containing UPF0001 family protein